MVTYGGLTGRDRSVVLVNITDLIAICEGTVCLPIIFEDLLFCGLMVFLFIVNFTRIYVNLYCVYKYIQYIHTYSNFILCGDGAGLVLIVRIMYSNADSMASN